MNEKSYSSSSVPRTTRVLLCCLKLCRNISLRSLPSSFQSTTLRFVSPLESSLGLYRRGFVPVAYSFVNKGGELTSDDDDDGDDDGGDDDDAHFKPLELQWSASISLTSNIGRLTFDYFSDYFDLDILRCI